MKPKIILAGSSLLFHPNYQYNPFTTVWQLQQEGPGIQAAFRKEEQLVRGRTPKQPVEEAAAVEVATVEINAVPTVEAVPVEQPIAPATPPATEVPKRKLVLKLKNSTSAPTPAPVPEKRKLKLVLKNQPSQ